MPLNDEMIPLGAISRDYKRRAEEDALKKPKKTMGWTTDVERINGRVAMISVVIIAAREIFEGLSIPDQLLPQ